MIERVARAIKQRENQDGNYHDLARAAIAAMREPTADMLAIHIEQITDSYKPVWQAMIDSALEDECERAEPG
jgi:hypothetical protein